MASSDDELELLLAFQSVPETPPSSPSRSEPHSPENGAGTPLAVRSALAEVFGYESEDVASPNRKASMEVFREVVKLPPKNASSGRDHHKYSTSLPEFRPLHCPIRAISDPVEVESNSRLRIRDRIVSQTHLNNQLLDLRFVPLQAIKMASMFENIKGAWATIGVLAEKGTPRVSSTGQNFAIWKVASLDSTPISIFLFGEAFRCYYKEPAGCIFAVFNAKVRNDKKRKEISLNISANNQLLKLGTSVDFAVCKGKRKDGTPCTSILNRRHGEYCQYHSNVARQKYKSQRAELNGGKLSTNLAIPLKGKYSKNVGCFEEGLSIKREKPVKVMSVEGLKRVLGNADKVTSKFQSQGIRFLACVAKDSKENINPNLSPKGQSMKSPQLQQTNTELGLPKHKRKRGISNLDPVQKRMAIRDPVVENSNSGEVKKRQSVKSLTPTSRNLTYPPQLLELDLDEQDNFLDDDTAMAQTIKLFGKGISAGLS